MTIDQENDRHIIAAEGKVFQRISDNSILGREIWLGNTYWLNGKRLGVPLLERPEHFREIDEEETDDTPVVLSEEPQPAAAGEETAASDGPADESPNPVTAGDVRRLQRQMQALTAMSCAVINALALPADVAITVQELYPVWEELWDTKVMPGFRFRCKEILYEVLKEHSICKEWAPGAGTAALYKAVAAPEGCRKRNNT